MAPALMQNAPAPPHTLAEQIPVSKAIFPDGLKTSGQHGPIFERLKSYADFPKEITGPTVWKAEDYRDNPERWTHVFSNEEIAELSKASDNFIASGVPLTGMRRDLFPLPKLAPFFNSVRKELINGKGFILFKGIPVQDWGNHKCAVNLSIALMTLISHIKCRTTEDEQRLTITVHSGSLYGSRLLLRLLHKPK